MRRREWDIAKEWIAGLAINKVERLLRDHIMRVRGAFPGLIAGYVISRQWVAPVIVIQKFGIEEVCVNLVQVTEELIEAVFPGHSSSAFISQTPLTKPTGRIPSRLQHLGDSNIRC